MQEPIDLVATEQEKRAPGIGLSVGVSLVLHTAFVTWFILTYKPAPKAANDVPMAQYIELVKRNPQEFTEAPGKWVNEKPIRSAPLSDKNRKAATPNPSGDKPTLRPGNDGGVYQPPVNRAPRGPQSTVLPQMATQPAVPTQPSASTPSQADPDQFVYREPTQAAAAAPGPVDWNKAVREVRKIASLGGGDGLDLGTPDGGEKGFADTGPLSFETQWYDWGPYSQSMVSRIRVNWYANMPQIFRTGMAGVVTIRFTIHRDGHITDIVVLKTSGIPPYDFAARKAIELSSPLNPLPANFPNPTERVTAMFYYNMDVPGR